MADVLWDAANEYLWAGDVRAGLVHSCGAALLAADQRLIRWGPIRDLLFSLGCECNSLAAFRDFPAGPKRQGVRYMWLLLAYHYALDEGLTC